MTVTAVFDAHAATPVYPRTYRPPLSQRVMLAIFGALCLSFGAAALWLWAQRHDLALLLLSAFLSATGIGLALAKLGSAILLTSDAIERRGLLGRRALRRVDIAGCRLGRGGRGYMRVVLTPKSAALRPLAVEVYAPDAAFARWFAGLPDLDLLEKAKGERDLMRDPGLGETIEQRRSAMTRLGRLARAASVAGGAVLVWAMVLPLPRVAAVAVSALAPACALALVIWSGGRLVLFPARNEPRPAIPGLMLAGLALPARALFDITLDDWAQSIAAALALGAVITLGLWLANRHYQARLGALAGFAVGACLYGWGLVCEVDRWVDDSQPRVFATQVLDEHVSAGRYTRYVLTLAPWDHGRAAREFGVTRALYEASPVGAPVCVLRHRGALDIGWLQFRRCPPS
jgi:hypothetical protein